MVSQAASLATALESMEIRPEHQALVGLCEGLAEQIDLFPARATLWREYLPALNALMAVSDVEEDDGQTRLLELVRTPVRDKAKPGAGDDGAGDRGGSRKSRPAADAVAATGGRRRRGASA